jgi:hypothetical protein
MKWKLSCSLDATTSSSCLGFRPLIILPGGNFQCYNGRVNFKISKFVVFLGERQQRVLGPYTRPRRILPTSTSTSTPPPGAGAGNLFPSLLGHANRPE